MAKRRVDTLLAERGLFPSRSSAAASVMAGEVRVGGPHGRRAAKPSELVDVEELLTLEERPQFVSRGGVKLANALASSRIEVAGRRALDVGASTGGFTDCLLQRGAREVIAVDVGYGVLDYSLRRDARACRCSSGPTRALCSARCSPLLLAAARKQELPDLATIDVSFISLQKVLAAVISCLQADYDVLALVKPQFELGRGRVGKGGVVRDAAARREALLAVGVFALSSARACAATTPPACLGPRGTARASCGSRRALSLRARVSRSSSCSRARWSRERGDGVHAPAR